MMSYPDKLLRGIPNRTYLDEDGRVTVSIFQFSDNVREDGFTEASINWIDDDFAVEHALKQTKSDGNIQFSAGVAIMLREWVDDTICRPMFEGLLDYERAPLEDNRYHGNLLRKGNEKKSARNIIAASLAMAVESIIEQP